MAQHGETRADCEKPEVAISERYTDLGNGKVRFSNWLGKESYKDGKTTLWKKLVYVDTVIDTSTIPNPVLVLAQHASTKLDIDEEIATEVSGADLYAEKPRKSAPKQTFEQMLVAKGQAMLAEGRTKEEIAAFIMGQMRLG